MDDELLALARKGDERAFQSLVGPRRTELQAHCYRMLGSAADAEDAVQETLVRAWKGLPRFENRSSFRSWLYRIATNTCLSSLQQRSRRFLPVTIDVADGDGDAGSEEVSWLEPYPVPPDGDVGRSTPEARYELLESVELAFVVAVQELSPNERAVLLLRDVLGFSAREAADQLDTSVAAITSSLQRARQRVEGRLPARSQQVEQAALGSPAVQALVARYMDALDRGDVEAIVALLTEDATWSMPPSPVCYRGLADIVGFLERGPITVRWRHQPTSVNGQPAVACYAWDGDEEAFVAYALDVLTLRGGRIEAITAFLDPTHIERIGLPRSLPVEAGQGGTG